MIPILSLANKLTFEITKIWLLWFTDIKLDKKYLSLLKSVKLRLRDLFCKNLCKNLPLPCKISKIGFSKFKIGRNSRPVPNIKKNERLRVY